MSSDRDAAGPPPGDDRPDGGGPTALVAVAVDGGALPLGGGLLALVRPALDLLLQPGGVLAVLSTAPSLREDLPTWCRMERHAYLGVVRAEDGRDRHLVQRGDFSATRAAAAGAARPLPERADPHTGFAPRDARVEPGGPAYPFTLVERDRVAPEEVTQLYDQAVGAQWDASDIPWEKVGRLPPLLENAVTQVMSFLAENELAALYVPARFLPRIHPAYAEVAMFLATQLADEARHVDVFLKRARARGGAPPVSSVATARSLFSLLALEDFTEASFLLSVMGEGTFLDLLRFVEEHAPDEATAELARRARADETRHVHFGLAHVRHALAHDPSLFPRLEAAVRRRAATLQGIADVPAPLQDALTVLAAHGTEPPALARGHEAFRALLDTMREGRLRRLRHAGFNEEQAGIISDLHSPNFM